MHLVIQILKGCESVLIIVIAFWYHSQVILIYSAALEP